VRWIDLLQHSVKCVLRGRTRSALAAIAVSIGVFAIVLISSAGNSGQEMILEEVERLGIQGLTVYTKDKSGLQLHPEDLSIAKDAYGVDSAMPIQLEYCTFESRNRTGNCLVWGVTEELSEIMNLHLISGRFFRGSDLLGKERVVIIDDGLANDIVGNANPIGRTLTITTTAGKEMFTVVGVVKSQKAGLDQLLGEVVPQFLYVPYETLCEMTGRTTFEQLAISCISEVNPDEVGERVVQKLDRISGMNAYQYQNISGYKENLVSITELVESMISVIAAISLLVAGICVMSSMLSSAAERKREIGICMAIGAEKRDIMRCFLLESIMISVAGGIIGAALATVVIKIAESILGVAVTVAWDRTVAAELFACGLGIVVGMIPARKAAELDPICALREEI